MVVTAEQIEEMKNYFRTANIPDKEIKLDQASTQFHVAEQITEKINLLESGTLSDIVAQTFLEKLQQIKNAMLKTD